MAHRLAVRQLHHYDPAAPGIPVPVTLRAGRESLSCWRTWTPSSTVCIFRRDHAEALGLPLELGVRQRIRTAAGAFETFGHSVSLSVLDMQFETLLYFAASPETPAPCLAASASWTAFASA